MSATPKYYVTTPIYYVNDRPHIGHLYTTTVADVLARHHRMLGDDVFFLTGTDEHAAKVSNAAAERGRTAQEWADENAAVFERTFVRMGLTHDDFIRTSQPRHKSRVTEYVGRLLATGDVEAGEYEGWYDASQEEYVPENRAKETDYKSPVTGRPLERRKERNYFFRLSRYQQRLLDLIETHNPTFVQPEARRNEVLSRIRDGLNDVPISRTGAGGWGISMPGDEQQTIYVWIDALFNYLTAVDVPDRIERWPADVHLIAKDILKFHAVIWPALLMALDRPLPAQVYAHSFWIHEGQKMGKSLGNFIDLARIDACVAEFGLDALRYFLVADGPLGATDSDFAQARFTEVYNSDLANTLGNCSSRITNMTGRFFAGRLPAPGPRVSAGAAHDDAAERCVERALRAFEQLKLADAAAAGLDLVRAIDGYIELTQPFKLAKDPDRLPEVGTILYNCAEALRIASLLLWPIVPERIEQLWQRLGCGRYTSSLAERGRGELAAWCRWGQSVPGTAIAHGDPLFPRKQ